MFWFPFTFLVTKNSVRFCVNSSFLKQEVAAHVHHSYSHPSTRTIAALAILNLFAQYCSHVPQVGSYNGLNVNGEKYHLRQLFQNDPSP